MARDTDDDGASILADAIDGSERKPEPEPESKSAAEGDRGIRFTNKWNGSISNGKPITLQWNESIDATEGTLKLYKVGYPEDGLVELELVSNVTGSLDGTWCSWTPSGLGDELYSLWLTTKNDGAQYQAISPPWKPQEDESGGLHWSVPIGVPIVVILSIYLISLIICLVHRRRKRAKLAKASKKPSEQDPQPMPADAERHPSVSSVGTVQTYTEDDELIKKEDGVWVLGRAGRSQSIHQQFCNPSYVDYGGDGRRGRQCSECGSDPRYIGEAR